MKVVCGQVVAARLQFLGGDFLDSVFRHRGFLDLQDAVKFG